MRRLPVIHAALLACMMVLTADLARAQYSGGEEENAESFKYGADYYAAGLDPKLKTWLALVERGHVNERVWNAYRAGQYGVALDDAKYALTRFPNHPRVLGLVGEIGKATGQLSVPITYYEQALNKYPQYAFTHAQYGHFLVEIGAVGAGAAELQEALRLNPNLVSARAWLNEIEPASRPSPAIRDTVGASRTGAGGN